MKIVMDGSLAEYYTCDAESCDAIVTRAEYVASIHWSTVNEFNSCCARHWIEVTDRVREEYQAGIST